MRRRKKMYKKHVQSCYANLNLLPFCRCLCCRRRHPYRRRRRRRRPHRRHRRCFSLNDVFKKKVLRFVCSEKCI